MQVDLNPSELASGQALVLTLQDQGVLDGEGEQDVLENVDVKDAFKQSVKDRRSKQIKTHQNSKYLPGEEEEDDWGEGGVLDKYDDVEESALAKRIKNRIKIGHGTPSQLR